MIVPRFLVVDREKFTLDVYRWRVRQMRYNRMATYLITVGAVGHETPHGMYFVQAKSRTPDWRVPSNDDYPEYLWGKIYKFGEEGNPFAGGFLSLGGEESGVGIHGTSFDPRVGTASSHGCVRMRTEDFLEIYDKVAIDTPVYLH